VPETPPSELPYWLNAVATPRKPPILHEGRPGRADADKLAKRAKSLPRTARSTISGLADDKVYPFSGNEGSTVSAQVEAASALMKLRPQRRHPGRARRPRFLTETEGTAVTCGRS
jgi:hypothetical protein